MRFECRGFVRLLILVLLSFCLNAEAAVYNHFKVVGARRLTSATILHYIPFKKGQNLTQNDFAHALKKLYDTGLFKQAQFLENGSTLVIKVKENPTIARILVEGGEKVGQDKILKALSSQKISAGMILNPKVYASLKQSIVELYQEQSYHNVKVNLMQKQLGSNKVLLTIKIHEGKEGTVRSITVSGNKAVASSEITGKMELKPELWSFLTHNNNFSNHAYMTDLQSIRQLYFAKGYLQASIVKHKEVWDGDHVDLTIVIHEGQPFYFAKIELNAPKKFRADLDKELKHFKVGQLYDHAEVHKVVTRMFESLAAKGYAFVNIDPRIQLHPKSKKVDLLFQVKLGPRVMVRNIGFSGNKHTQDYVLRREMLQLEASQYNQGLVKLSERNINNLGYIRNAKCIPVKVGGRSDIIDLKCAMEEVPSTVASASVGYSTQSGLIYKIDFDQKNFVGTGRRITVNAEKSDTVVSGNVAFSDPYFLDSNISDSFHINVTKTKNVKGSVAKYQTNDYGLSNDIGIPLSNFSRLVLGLGYRHTDVVKYDDSYGYIDDFISQHGTKFDTYDFHMGWRSNTYDRIIFPLDGISQDLSAYVGLPIGDKSLQYYQLGYKMSLYKPIFDTGLTGQLVTQLGYGRGYGDFDTLPFFKNYWAGGEGSVRGFSNNSLGPKDTAMNTPMGGNVLTLMSLNLFMPQWFGDDIRFGAFVDVGNVFDDEFKFDELRSSGGVVVQWRTPMAPIALSLGYPLSKKSGDELHAFSFSLSTNI